MLSGGATYRRREELAISCLSDVFHGQKFMLLELDGSCFEIQFANRPEETTLLARQ